MVLVLGDRKSGVLNISLDLPSIEMAERHFAKALPHKQFGASNVIRRHCCVSGALGEAHRITGKIDHILAVVIATADSANVTDVMAQKRDDEMQPVARGNAPNADVPAAQNFLPDEGHHDGMIHVMVGGVAVCNILKRELSDEADDARIAWLEHPIGPFVHDLKFVDECLNDD